MSDEEQKRRINLGYPLAQLAKALAGVGERAARRIQEWQQVLAGLHDRTLDVGSRTPVANMPAWVTLEVVHGGFATGNLAAGGALLAHERDELARLTRPAEASERATLNLYYSSGAGRAELEAMLREGLYRVHVPEEAALLVLTWLVSHDERARAERLIEAIGPYFDRLRFYPVPSPRPLRSDASVYLATVGETLRSIRAQRRHEAVERMKEAIQIWAPLYDATVALFLETVAGDTPRLRTTASGELAKQVNGGPIVEGGWPCSHFPGDWNARAGQVLETYREQRAAHQLCAKPERRKENFARLRGYLARCIEDRASVTKYDQIAIRQILASYVSCHGAPGSDRLQQVRAEQTKNAALPSHRDIASILASRLENDPPDEGAPGLREKLRDLSPDEASRIGAPAGVRIPPALAAKAMRCLEAPLETLVAEEILPSAEAMSKVLPLLSARVRASSISHPELRRVYEAVYTAFRRRRSLLLLDLQSQVKLAELPWIQAIAPWIGGDDESRRSARETMTRVTRLALETFPQTIFPNGLVKELRALAATAGQPLPLVRELAADIFMGAFSGTYLEAARDAARLLKGTLYERYFGLPYERVLRLEPEERSSGRPVAPQLMALCEELAGSSHDGSGSVARNGTIIEQCQIVTTHNLATLFAGLDLAGSLRPSLSPMARTCFEWICARHQMPIRDWQARMQMVKNTAYAWRQMMFFISLLDGTNTAEFLRWLADHFAAQAEPFRRRFAPVVTGLQAVAAGARFNSEGIHPSSGGRRLLGWSEGRHWLLSDSSMPS